MTSMSDNSKTRQFTGKHFLIFIVSFFVVILTANGMMAYFAIDTFSGLETDDAYRKGRDYNDALAAAEAQAELGWQEEISFTRIGEGDVSSHHITLIMHGDEIETGLKAKLLVRRPATNMDDQLIPLVETSPAHFEGVIMGLGAGKWKWSLVVEKQDLIIFRKNSEFMIGDE